ncbi:RNA polymerase sigma factor [Hymenobacter elongatus]|uniref:RNA polymerase sigma factor n=1 Tax=Hymenobacter elongatus TaxID=877208 RepID=UPI00143685E0|nr:RNA polymerase sigma factor [Hymenobacter elongatus]
MIARALAGDHQSLSDLVKIHQPYIYNVALKMLNHVADAEDLTQEILVKLVTSLSLYNPVKGRFRTWLYRITFNHFLNLKKQPYEQAVPSFEVLFSYIDNTPDAVLTPDEEQDL